MGRGASGGIGFAANLAACAACFGAAVLLHYPGHLTFDAITIWYESRQPTLFSQHPPALALLWHFLEYIVPGPGGFLVVQLGTLWLAAGFLVARAGPPPFWALAFYAGLFLCPPVFAISPQLGKDPLGAHLALLALVAVLPLGPAPPPRIAAPLGFAASALAAMLRYQFGIVTLALFFALWRRDRRGAAAGLAAVAATVLLVKLAIAATFAPAVVSDVARSVRKILVYDIAGASALDAAADVPVFAAHGVDAAEFERRATRLYTPDRVDFLWQPDGVFPLLDALPDAAIRAQWWNTATRAPVALLRHRLLAFGRVIGLGEVYACWPVAAGISERPAGPAAALDADSYAPALSTAILTSRWFPAGTFLFRGWVYGAVGLLVLVAYARRRAPFAAAALAASGIAYELTFALLPQACDVRYSYFLIVASLFAAAATVFHTMRNRHL